MIPRFRMPVRAAPVFLVLACWATAADAQPFDPQPMKQFIGGVDVNEILGPGNDQALYNALTSFGVSPPKVFSFGQWIQQIRQDADAMSGLGGIPARAFLDAAELAAFSGATVEITGQIPESVDLGSYTEPGFYYNAIAESCHLWVTMVTTVTSAGGPPPPPKSVAYRWKVSVAGGHCKVAQRDDSNPFDVFPASNTVSIPASMAGGFQFKLWARGTSISISVVERDANYDESNPNFVTLNPNSAAFASLYQTDDESCIDMMFEDPPPETLPTDAAPPFYCLGRCDDPPIINTM